MQMLYNTVISEFALGRCRYSNSLLASQSGDRIAVGRRFTAPVQTDNEAHSASCILSNHLFQGAKRQGCGVAHPPPSSAKVKERV